jgi:transposase InsO family protein
MASAARLAILELRAARHWSLAHTPARAGLHLAPTTVRRMLRENRWPEPSFGAIGKYGSLAVIERSIRTLKTDCTRRLVVVPYRLAAFEKELRLCFSWHTGHRPHSRLGGATPDEVYHHRRPAHRAPRFEPRPRWPRRSPCASSRTLVRGHPGVKLHRIVRYQSGRRHLPIVTLERAA